MNLSAPPRFALSITPVVRRLNAALAAVRAWLAARVSRYAREITVVLLVKAIALAALWWAFFSQPAADRLRSEPAQIERAILGAPSPSVVSDAQR
jgi:type II secretory pathway component PulM